ncbi:MAG: glycine--tRNA ligase subunit beta [Pseudanabaenaceae cyanobacterium SKYGB_i_bin29]|nr:glycine--tRNA ligase subunit beta [Pseudanabaenaceae cyanobacterium SKYG29]MDW8420627.1 glycine--tRNA ligase subunit beta [Pseudanabaenaceae cyanobacterium SKYGB_i_bin29]
MATYLLEVGTEELPASFVAEALAQWQEKIPASLQEHNLTCSNMTVYGTPRRLAVCLEGLPEQQPDQELEIKGPAVASAYSNGEPTKALLGFLRSKGLDLADLYTRTTDKGEFVFAKQRLRGKATPAILPALAATWITKLEGKRLMRWGNRELKFPRPIRWLVSLWDDQVLPLQLEDIQADRVTYGHRVLSKGKLLLSHARDYVEVLKENGVLVDVEERQKQIVGQMQQLADLMGAKVESPPELLAEVVNLVEFPTAIVGEFDAEFLQLPPQVITTEMIAHQRYFPLWDRNCPDRLLPFFITISNGDPSKSKLIAQGNGRVIRARLADGKFFYDTDRQVKLETYVPQLEKVTFQEQLGSVGQKVERLRQIVKLVFRAIPNVEPMLEVTDRAAYLCKADLVTQMVKEFPELQGIMGADYALHSGEPPLVAQAIKEHYQPRGANDQLPQSVPGQILAIADRLDTLVGIFGLGMLPTGSSDPFALRRAAQGIVQICWHYGWQLNLPQVLKDTIGVYTHLPRSGTEIYSNLIQWFQQRCETLLKEEIDYDLVDAVLGVGDPVYTEWSLSNVAEIKVRAEFLQRSRQNQTLTAIYEVVNRASRLANQENIPTTATSLEEMVKSEKLQEPAEIRLYQALQELPSKPQNYEELVTAIAQVAPHLANFFDAVLVMVDDPDIRANRLAMLGYIRNYSRQLADFSAMRSL